MSYLNFVKVGDTIYHPKHEYGKVQYKDTTGIEVHVKTPIEANIWLEDYSFYMNKEHYENTLKEWEKFPEILKDKDLIWCWDDEAYTRELRFYDVKGNRTFSVQGKRDGYRFTYMEKYIGEYPEWAKEVRAKLKD